MPRTTRGGGPPARPRAIARAPASSFAGGARSRRTCAVESSRSLTASWSPRGDSGRSPTGACDDARHRSRPTAGTAWPILELGEPTEWVSADRVWAARVSESAVALRDLTADREIGEFECGSHISSVRIVSTSSPRWLVSVGEDGTLAIWPLRTDDLASQACARLRAIFPAQALGKLIAAAHAERSCETK